MTIHAYNELYLNDAITCLANAFDYAINTCKQDADWFAKLFSRSDIAGQFEKGNPAFVSGKSGEELALMILTAVYPDETFPPHLFFEGRTPEYWAGWALAQYQWATAKSFKNIFERIPLSEIISMYHVFHEMDITRFIDSLERKYKAVKRETNLKKIRESRQISQAELSKLSGVSLRSVQLYEQRVNDIDKAQAQTLYKLSLALGCDIADLLEAAETVE